MKMTPPVKVLIAALLFVAVISGLTAEQSTDNSHSPVSEVRLNLSFGKGPETLIAMFIPNVSLDYFPFKQDLFYTGVSLNLLTTSGHIGGHIGLSTDYFGCELSTAVTAAQNPFSYDNQKYFGLSINPKVWTKYSFTDSPFSLFLKLGPSVILESSNTFPPGVPLVDFWKVLGVPLNIEAGLGWDL